MSNLGWILVIFLCAEAAASSGGSAGRGQMLYENHCAGCHISTLHVRSDRRAESLEAVQFQVGRWSTDQGLGWNGEDITDVVEYLNEMFYQFDHAGTPVVR